MGTPWSPSSADPSISLFRGPDFDDGADSRQAPDDNGGDCTVAVEVVR